MRTKAYLSLGSNIDREANIRVAVARLREDFPDMRVSPVYESEAVGFDGENFLNLIVCIDTDDSLEALSVYLKSLEDTLGRKRQGAKFSARTIDIDIVTYGERAGCFGGVELPRPELYFNAFVLKPLVDLAPEDIDPKSGKTFRELDQMLELRQSLWKVSFNF